MGFSKYCLLVAATVLLLALEKQSDAGLINNELFNPFLDAKGNPDIKAAVAEDRNIISKMATKAIGELHAFAANYTRSGPIGEAIEILRDGWEKTIKLDAVALNAALDLFDNILSKDIEDKVAALNEINNGINNVRTLIYKAGNEIHSSLGAANSKVKITDKGEYKHAIDTIQETGSGLFDNLESAQFYANQGIKSANNEVKRKQLEAAHSSIMSTAEMCNTNLVLGAEIAIKYLALSDKKTITQPEPIEELISDKARAAAAADSDTMAAMDVLNKEFNIAIKLGINPSVLKELKKGLEEYIDLSALAVALCYEAIAEAKVLVKTDPQAAIDLIEKTFKIAKAVLIDGSVKAYEGIGYAGLATGLLEKFHDAIEIAERSRVEGTKGFDSAKTVAVRAIVTGGKASDHALATSHKMLEANEAFIFEDLDAIIKKAIEFITLSL